ncbi:MAG: zinc ribbon domain-containing protein [Lachnospiraceae bacterium]|nr:zinc ribbon domain-containing protein [Lachnospiraceae bacterium]
MATNKFCQYCGAPLEPDSVFCSSCGGRQDAAGDTPMMQPNRGSADPGATIQPKQPAEGTAPILQPVREKQPSEEVKTKLKGSINSGDAKLRPSVRNYYLSSSSAGDILLLIGVIMIAIGFLLLIGGYNNGEDEMAFVGVGMLVVGICLTWGGAVLKKQAAGSEADAIAAIHEFREYLKNRALGQLGVDESEVNIIEPIVLYGFGRKPDDSFVDTEVQLKSAKAMNVNQILKNSVDPVRAYKMIDGDTVLSMLIQVTVFYFTEKQILIYSGDIDTSTGKLYNETTMEAYYRDVTRISTEKKLWKLYSDVKQKNIYKVKESLYLSIQGEKMSFSINSELTNSVVDEQIAGMKALVREKKS